MKEESKHSQIKKNYDFVASRSVLSELPVKKFSKQAENDERRNPETSRKGRKNMVTKYG